MTSNPKSIVPIIGEPDVVLFMPQLEFSSSAEREAK